MKENFLAQLQQKHVHVHHRNPSHQIQKSILLTKVNGGVSVVTTVKMEVPSLQRLMGILPSPQQGGYPTIQFHGKIM